MPFPIMTSVDLITAKMGSPTLSPSRSAELRVMTATSFLLADADPDFGHEALDVEGDHPATQLVSGAQIESAELDLRTPAERGIEVPLIEEPPPPHPPAGEPGRRARAPARA